MFQRLSNVCNGGHIYCLDSIHDERELKAQLGVETKAIMIVEPDQDIMPLLRRLSRRKKGLRTKRLARWSEFASLWMVRC